MLHIVGDINLTDWMFNAGFGLGTRIERGFNPFKYLNRNDEDLWIGNFEGVASSITANSGIYAKVFRVNPDALRHLRHMDIYGFANNHAMEHGEKAYQETVEALESYGCKVFGLDKARSLTFYHQNQKCSITGMCLRVEDSKYNPLYWYNPEYAEIEEEIASLSSDAFKILFIHWGNEYINRPSVSQKKFAHWLIDSGFDLIIGMHPHVLQGYEVYKGKRIYYSLGNFVFDMPSEQCKIGALVEIEFKNGLPNYSEHYIYIDQECCPHVVEEKKIPSHWHFDYLNDCLKKNDNSEQYHTEIKKGYLVYRKVNRRKILKSLFIHPVLLTDVFIDFIKRKIK